MIINDHGVVFIQFIDPKKNISLYLNLLLNTFLHGLTLNDFNGINIDTTTRLITFHLIIDCYRIGNELIQTENKQLQFVANFRPIFVLIV